MVISLRDHRRVGLRLEIEGLLLGRVKALRGGLIEARFVGEDLVRGRNLQVGIGFIRY